MANLLFTGMYSVIKKINQPTGNCLAAVPAAQTKLRPVIHTTRTLPFPATGREHFNLRPKAIHVQLVNRLSVKHSDFAIGIRAIFATFAVGIKAGFSRSTEFRNTFRFFAPRTSLFYNWLSHLFITSIDKYLVRLAEEFMPSRRAVSILTRESCL
jgi:hypothetical protein